MTDTTTHDTITPGPWHAAGLTIRDADSAHIANVLPYHYVEADGVTVVPIPEAEAEANARAIAALPALIEAARDVLDSLTDAGEHRRPDGGEYADVAALRAALAQIDGDA